MTNQDPQAAYWSALEQGRLCFQHCRTCANNWLPARTECPRCWSVDWTWEQSAGEGRVVSWVVFHTAFHEAFKSRLPYNVAVVELVEGPRLVTNLIEPFKQDEVVDQPCRLIIEKDHNRALPRFRLA
jgi:uncharacterized OB-fold protein